MRLVQATPDLLLDDRLHTLRKACLWRIDTVGVKRSDLRSAQQPRTQALDDLIGSLSKVDRIPERSRVFGKITQPLVSDIRIDSEVAIERSGDLRLVVTQPDSGMGAMVVEVGPEIVQLVFEIRRSPEQNVIQILPSNGAD